MIQFSLRVGAPALLSRDLKEAFIELDISPPQLNVPSSNDLQLLARLLQYKVSISGCQDSRQFSFPHFATILVLSTSISTLSCLGAIYYNSPPISIDSWSLGNIISIILLLYSIIIVISLTYFTNLLNYTIFY